VRAQIRGAERRPAHHVRTCKPAGARPATSEGFLEMPYAEVDRIAKMIPPTSDDGGGRVKGNGFREMIYLRTRRSPTSSASRGRSRGATGTRNPRLAGGVANRRSPRLPLYRQATARFTTSRDGTDRADRARESRLPRLRRLTAIDDTLKLLESFGNRHRPERRWSLDRRGNVRWCWTAETQWGSSRLRRGVSPRLVKNSSPTSFNHLVDLVAPVPPRASPERHGGPIFVERGTGAEGGFPPSPIEGDPRGHVRRHPSTRAGDGDRQGAGRVHAARADVLRRRSGRKDTP